MYTLSKRDYIKTITSGKQFVKPFDCFVAASFRICIALLNDTTATVKYP